MQKDTEQLSELFTLLDNKDTRIDFINQLKDDHRVNVFDYVNVYNGGGVAIGDINNDGLQDIYFTANMVSNRLYLNKGNMKFEDITERANVSGENGWSTGVTMIDINNDGYIDIYVCRAFNDEEPELRENLLYINNGDMTFTERAQEYGINDGNHSTQALFLDYDLDGYMDLFVGNHPREYITRNDKIARFKKRQNPPLDMSDRLFRNNGNGSFQDVTTESGILNHGFTLGIGSSDINNDGWPDIYVAVDHAEPDYYYVNNKDGTFSNRVDGAMKHISNFGMGLDIADINNDALLDIVELDMMAKDNFRQKTQMSGMAPERFWLLVAAGYHYQYMRNTLQLNNGNGSFSEIGQLSGISNTDWSWAALLADFDNDGNKDLYVCNGHRKDFRDNDYSKKLAALTSASSTADSRTNLLKASYEISKEMPETPLSNYLFKNNGNLTFSDISEHAGVTKPSYSYGAAYGDLDNDGDLDLVVSNLDSESFVYRNNAKSINHYNNLRIKLIGDGRNTQGIGSKLTIKYGDELQFQELALTRGFQSSVEDYIHFGLKDHSVIDELKIEWPDGRTQVISNVPTNQILAVYQKNALLLNEGTAIPETLFADVTSSTKVEFAHKEQAYDDYALEVLLPHRMSQFGPKLTVGDVDGDGKEDFFIGGAAGQSGALYIQTESNSFRLSNNQPWAKELEQEDIGTTLFDADGDGDQDLYIVSGSNEFQIASNLYEDRLYINNGNGNFSRAKDALPKMLESGGCVVPGDYDNDGDLDLFVGGRQIPGKYPFPAKSYLLRNDNGRFYDVTSSVAPGLVNIGMVTSAIWTNVDDDHLLDLIVVGEWMPISVFKNNGNNLELISGPNDLGNTNGWWNKIVAGDFDNDGDDDYILGNLGVNYKYKATLEEPFHIYTHDFDSSGSLDIVLGYFNEGVCYPLRGRQCSSQQIPSITKKFGTYKEFASADIRGVYGDALDSALHYEAKIFSSIYLRNDGNGDLTMIKLPIEAQFSTIRGIIPHDLDKDGNLDLLIAGNFYVSEVETGRADASIGLYLKGDGSGEFQPLSVTQSGFNAHLDVRDIALINKFGTPMILIANNNDSMQIFEYKGINNYP